MTGAQIPIHAYLYATRAADKRARVAFVRGEFNRRNHTPFAEQVIVQARRTGGIAVRTDDAEARMALLELGTEG